MNGRLTTSLGLAVALAFAAGVAGAQEHHDEHGGGGGGGGGRQEAPRQEGPRQEAPRQAEPHPGPRGYQRPAEPQGWNARPARPAAPERGAFQHNFQAARTYHVGPFHPREGWAYRRWNYGQVYPRAFWGADDFLADYWLFGLEVPPAGYEWVRNGPDALLIDTDTGEILQVEYGAFG